PWDFMQELPSVDELVVYLLRSEAITANGGQRPSQARDYRVLRQIALQHPELTNIVWLLLGRSSSTFAWSSGSGVDRTSGSSGGVGAAGGTESATGMSSGARTGARFVEYD
ncbi:MAG: hypothetical protein LH471_00100, partial [Salinibacterium sp.]|nr:hypothetical protein [Salinibacterium sp.]